jgi:hypothetical protein
MSLAPSGLLDLTAFGRPKESVSKDTLWITDIRESAGKRASRQSGNADYHIATPERVVMVIHSVDS